MKTSYFFTFVLLLSSILGLVEAQPSLRVGLIAPISGDFATYGVGALKAMRLATDSILGRPVEILVEDNRTCQSGDAITAFQKLVSVEKVELIVTFCTAAAQGILPLAMQRHIPLIQITEPGMDPKNYMLKMMPESLPFAGQLAKDLRKKYSKIALVGNLMEVNTGSRGNLPLFKKSFEQLGGQVVLTETFPDSETDFQSLVLKVRSSGAEAVSPFIWQPQQMGSFLKEGDRIRLWDKVSLAGNFVFELMYTQILPLYPRLKTMDGLESVNFVNQTNDSFVSRYKDRFNDNPPQFADYAYDVITIVKDCGTDTICFRKHREGVSGDISFSEDGRRIGRYISKKLVKGSFVASSDSMQNN